MVGLASDLRTEMASMHRELANAIVANGVQMRTLHEDLLERIKLLGESRHPVAKTPPQ
jgi:hypothetical protein